VTTLRPPASIHPLIAPDHVRSERDREQLIAEYARLVKYVVGRLGAGSGGAFDHADAMSVGTIGLIAAIDAWRHDAGSSFESYAITRIRGAIIDAIRSIDPIGRAARDGGRRIDRAVVEIETTIGRSATDEEIAEAIDWTVDEYRRALHIAHVATVSIEGDSTDPDDEGVGARLVDPAAEDPIARLISLDERDEIARAIGALPERQAQVIALYYVEELTFREIGEVIGVTESRACQIHAEAIRALRRTMGAETPAEHEPRRRRLIRTIDGAVQSGGLRT
jgi:RNA polymerase sigma factor for flagellar operon FliA